MDEYSQAALEKAQEHIKQLQRIVELQNKKIQALEVKMDKILKSMKND